MGPLSPSQSPPSMWTPRHGRSLDLPAASTVGGGPCMRNCWIRHMHVHHRRIRVAHRRQCSSRGHTPMGHHWKSPRARHCREGPACVAAAWRAPPRTRERRESRLREMTIQNPNFSYIYVVIDNGPLRPFGPLAFFLRRAS